MKPSSCKQKGRKGQQEIRDSLLESIYIPAGLEELDVRSTSMGVSGCDIQLSPAAKKVLDIEVEVKVVEALSVVSTFKKHFEKYKATAALKLLAHRRNHQEMLVTLRWADFIEILKQKITNERTNKSI